MEYSVWRNNTIRAKLETDKKYVILKMGSYLTSTAGLGWYVLYTLGAIVEAKKLGYIPVVDWKNCKLPHYNENRVGIDNVWEYFFEQPDGITLEEAYGSEDYYVLDDVRTMGGNIVELSKLINFDDENANYCRACFQKYIRLNKETLEIYNSMQREIGFSSESTAGVLIRGTDYAELKPAAHSKSPTIQEYFREMDLLLEINSNLKFYLATEDNKVLALCKERYGEKIISIESIRYQDVGSQTLNMIYKNIDGKERDLKYLFSIYTLSLCEYMILAPCGGSVLSTLLKRNTPKYYKFLYKGKNEIDGILVGSLLEKDMGGIIEMGKKPLMFYSLNMMRLIGIHRVHLLVSKEVKHAYEKILENGEKYGLDLIYCETEDYNFVRYVKENQQKISQTRVVVLHADTFLHGRNVRGDIVSEMNGNLDGTYAWAMTRDMGEKSLKMIVKGKIPVHVSRSVEWETNARSLLGYYVFDNELVPIVNELEKHKKACTIENLLNTYIERKKLFVNTYTDAMIGIILDNKKKVDNLSKLLDLYKELTGFEIGCFTKISY